MIEEPLVTELRIGMVDYHWKKGEWWYDSLSSSYVSVMLDGLSILHKDLNRRAFEEMDERVLVEILDNSDTVEGMPASMKEEIASQWVKEIWQKLPSVQTSDKSLFEALRRSLRREGIGYKEACRILKGMEQYLLGVETAQEKVATPSEATSSSQLGLF